MGGKENYQFSRLHLFADLIERHMRHRLDGRQIHGQARLQGKSKDFVSKPNVEG